MANGTNEDQQLDEFGFPIPSEEDIAAERQRIENERKKAATAIQLSGAASALEGALPSALPTQTAPMLPVDAPPSPMATTIAPPAGFEPALMAEQERLKQAAAVRAQIPGIGVRTDIPAAPDTQGRMYMGPNIGAADLARIPEGGRISLMPPSITPPASRLEQLQALDRPGSRTIGIREEPPYSDASLAASQNRMKYEAIQKFMAGDRSPEVLAAAIGTTRGIKGIGTPVKDIMPREYETDGQKFLVTPNGAIVPVRQQPTMTVTETIPATEGTPGSPGIPARAGFLGIGARPATPAVPPTPPSGERKIVRRVAAQPVPSKKSDLVVGRVYDTKRGPAKWDGKQFVLD